MTSSEQKTGTGSGKGLMAVAVGALLVTITGSLVTYWIQSKGAEAVAEQAMVAAGPATVVTTTPAITPSNTAARPSVAPMPNGIDVVHADVYFDVKSVRLRADAVRVLEEHAAMMDRGHVWLVLVQGYADRQGAPEYNRTLARRRADAVKQFMVELGVPETSMKVVTIGPEGAVCEDNRPECQQLDRRVHLEIRKLTPAAPAPSAS
jgi:outer membrane protein OmpA-like peptidoglycan-associated protein